MRATAPIEASSFRCRWGSVLAVLVVGLAGCDLTGEAAQEKAAAQREADGKAIGSACRHAGRAIEDCYALNAKAPRAAVFSGWREMDEYMRENKLEAVAPTLPPPGAKGEKGEKNDSSEKADKSAKPERAEKRVESGSAKVELPPKPRVAKPDHS